MFLKGMFDRIPESHLGSDYTGRIETNEMGEPVAVFKPNIHIMTKVYGPLTALFLMMSGETRRTEGELVKDRFNHDSSSLFGNEQTERALDDITKYRQGHFKVG